MISRGTRNTSDSLAAASQVAGLHDVLVVGVDDDRADEALLVAGRRDAEAFGLFYGRRVDAVLAFFLRRTGDRELAADLTAETFAAALSALPRYSPQRSSALAWLFTIAHHKLVDSIPRGQVADRGRRRMGLEPLVFSEGSGLDFGDVLSCWNSSTARRGPSTAASTPT